MVRPQQSPTLAEAQAIYFNALERAGFFTSSGEELIPVRGALGRTCSRAAVANRDVPHYRSAAMDGIAVRAADTVGASALQPLTLHGKRDFVPVDTGDPVPDPFDAIVMIERVDVVEANRAQITNPVPVGKHIREIGEDVRAGDVVLPAHRLITPEAMAALLNAGVFQIWARRRPSVVYIPTGSEITQPEQDLAVGQIPESNSVMIQGYAQWAGAVCHDAAAAPNDEVTLNYLIQSALADNDVVILGGGTSKGRHDVTAAAVRRCGDLLVHGVAYHPGHPVVLGIVGRRPVIGLPGYPVAFWMGIRNFVRPLLHRFLGSQPTPPRTVVGELAHEVRSVAGAREYVRVKLESRGPGYLVIPLPGGASRLSSLLHADGILEVAEEIEHVNKGATVTVELLTPAAGR